MSKVAVILAPGCEEGENLTIVDIMRRAEIPCELVGLDEMEVTGGHDITILADRVFDTDIRDYDMIVLPGGYGGAEAMMAKAELLSCLRDMDAAGKWVAAICAAPTVLDKAGILEGRQFTCYPTTAAKISSGERRDDIIVIDRNLVTSQGPATAYAFTYQLVELLGVSSKAVRDRMVYDHAFGFDGFVGNEEQKDGGAR